MSLPKSSDQEGKSVKADQELSPEASTDVIPAAPRKPRKFSKLVLLTASKDSAKVAGAKRKGVHCIMSLGVPGPATLAKALLKTHPEAQRAIEAAPQEPEQKRSKLDPGEALGARDGPSQRQPVPSPSCSHTAGSFSKNPCCSLCLPSLPSPSSSKQVA
ncbi:Hypothetical predicted protein [Marmota monax]|uniref:FLYWCH family member 2 n=1 Tax=Marmota monax TaxID=9995 RepID=A0A5E4AXP1_MARMO|nr:FLYWCH family member 2 [Marmota monax]VTJ62218.1 Hypothetical predicted protein [Marmota monax]